MRKTRHLKSGNFLTFILIIVCLFTASVFMYKFIVDKLVENSEMTKQSIKEEQFNIIWTSLENLQLEAEKDVTEISKNIESDLLNLSEEELLQLQEDMDNDILNHNLHEILNSNIRGISFNDVNNHMNGLVVMTTDGYIEDFNYHRAVISTEESIVRSWQVDIDKSYNKELEKDAIDKLLNRNSGVIALESYNLTKNENHIKIDELTYESLLKVFLTEGISGLRNYQIFVPYYITDFGDIFGNPDIMHGTKLDNNKLIIVQEFNLYDQIMENQDNLFNDKQIENVTARYDVILRLLYIFGISLITAIISLILYLCNIYNTLLYNESEETCIEESCLCDDETLLDSETQDNDDNNE